MGYLQTLQLMVRAYKAARGAMPKGLDLLKLKMKARQKVIDSKKVIEFPKDRITNPFKQRPQSKSEAEMLARMKRQNKEAVQRLKEKKKPRDDKATGGIANLSSVYDNNPTLQAQFPDKQDYLDLFGSTTTTTPQTQTYAQMTQQAPAGIPAVKPIVPIIPEGSRDDGGGGITSNKRNKNFDYETEAYGINPTGLSKDVFDYEYAAANANKGIFETLKQFSPTYQFMKAGKQLIDLGQKAIKDYFARKEAEKIAAAQLIAQQNIQQGSSGGPGEGAGTFGASINEATGARGPGTGFSDYS